MCASEGASTGIPPPPARTTEAVVPSAPSPAVATDAQQRRRQVVVVPASCIGTGRGSDPASLRRRSRSPLSQSQGSRWAIRWAERPLLRLVVEAHELPDQRLVDALALHHLRVDVHGQSVWPSRAMTQRGSRPAASARLANVRRSVWGGGWGRSARR